MAVTVLGQEREEYKFVKAATLVLAELGKGPPQVRHLIRSLLDQSFKYMQLTPLIDVPASVPASSGRPSKDTLVARAATYLYQIIAELEAPSDSMFTKWKIWLWRRV